jgi:hypothetical protein
MILFTIYGTRICIELVELILRTATFTQNDVKKRVIISNAHWFFLTYDHPYLLVVSRTTRIRYISKILGLHLVALEK